MHRECIWMNGSECNSGAGELALNQLCSMVVPRRRPAQRHDAPVPRVSKWPGRRYRVSSVVKLQLHSGSRVRTTWLTWNRDMKASTAGWRRVWTSEGVADASSTTTSISYGSCALFIRADNHSPTASVSKTVSVSTLTRELTLQCAGT